MGKKDDQPQPDPAVMAKHLLTVARHIRDGREADKAKDGNGRGKGGK